MSQTPIATTSSSNYQSIFDNAIEAYKKKTKKDLRSHPLLDRLQDCDGPDAVLKVLYEQIPRFDQSRDTDDNLTKWLNPAVNVLCTFSGVVGGSIGLASPKKFQGKSRSGSDILIGIQVSQPAAVIFTGIGVLLSVSYLIFHSIYSRTRRDA